MQVLTGSIYAWIDESGYAVELRRYPNFPRCLEVDAWGRPAPLFCFNNPDYRTWHLSIVEDYVESYELDGLAWCSERPGPLNLLMRMRRHEHWPPLAWEREAHDGLVA
jgi:hypothetical protein